MDFSDLGGQEIPEEQESNIDFSDLGGQKIQTEIANPILPMVAKSATSELGNVLGITSDVIRGKPEAIANVSSALIKPIPPLQQAQQWISKQGLVGKIGSYIVPTTALDIAAYGLNPEMEAPRVLSAVAKPIERGIQTIGKGIFGAAEQRAPKLVQQATRIFRDVLRPTQGEIKNIEIRGGKNIDDYYKLAAEEKLAIQQTADKKIDTTIAREQLSDKQSQIHDTLNNLLKRNDKTFNLNEVRQTAIRELKKKYLNASEYEAALNDVDNFIDAEIKKYGSEVVSAIDMNNIKQGMWQVGYNMMKPTASKTSRTIGHIIKEDIERKIADPSVKALNEQSGKYATLINLLENAQGRIIKGGRLGNYFAQTLGSIAGHSTGIPLVGPLIGAGIGEKIAGMINSPELASRIAASKMARAQKYIGKPPSSGQVRNIIPGAMTTVATNPQLQHDYIVGQIIDTPKGKVQVVGKDTDGHPLIKVLQTAVNQLFQ